MSNLFSSIYFLVSLSFFLFSSMVNAYEEEVKTLTFWSNGYQVLATEDKVEVLTDQGELITDIESVISSIISIRDENNYPVRQLVVSNKDDILRFNQLVVKDVLGGVVKNNFDNLGNTIKTIDPRGLATSYEFDDNGSLIFEESPSTGVIRQLYNKEGLKKLEIKGKDIVIKYRYDDKNRLKKVTYKRKGEDRKKFVYTYDSCNNGIDRLCKINNKESVIKYDYGNNGLLSSVKTRLKGSKRESIIKYDYNAYNQLEKLTYPDGLEVLYNRNQDMKVQSIVAKINNKEIIIADDIEWNTEINKVSSIRFGNGLSSYYNYNEIGNINSIMTDGVQNISYEYTPYLKNISNITDLLDSKNSQSFEYDLVDRIKSETRKGIKKEYFYDGVGNRILKVESIGNDTKKTKYKYSDSSNRLIGINNKFIAYDDNGNIIEDRNGIRKFKYDVTNRLESFYKGGILKSTYVYNALGQRIGKTRYRNDIKDSTTIYTYLPQGWLLNETKSKTNVTKGVSKNYIWFEGRPLAQIDTKHLANGNIKNHQVYYLHTDHLQTPRLATDETQNVVWRWDSDAFGYGKAQQDPDGDGKIVKINLRFAGQYYDRESGLHYNHHRDYDPKIGRYIQSDPIGLLGGINTYIYVRNNPLMINDPSGQFWVHIGSAIIGGTSAALGAWISGETNGNPTSPGMVIGAFAVGAAMGAANPMAGFASAEAALASLQAISIIPTATATGAMTGEVAKFIDSALAETDDNAICKE